MPGFEEYVKRRVAIEDDGTGVPDTLKDKLFN